MDAQNEGAEASRTHFRACKDSNFLGGVPPDYSPPSLPQSMLCGLLFVFALGPCNLRILRMWNTISRLRKLSGCAEHTSSYSKIKIADSAQPRKHYIDTRPFHCERESLGTSMCALSIANLVNRDTLSKDNLISFPLSYFSLLSFPSPHFPRDN